MVSLPPWLWVLIGLIVVVAALGRAFYGRWRLMCRSVREELAEFVRQHHPGAEVTGEQMGNLVVRLEDGSERVWEMADVYAARARIGGMGADPAACQQLCRQVAAAFFSPAPDAAAPLSSATHGSWIKPRLVRPDDAAREVTGDAPLQTPVPSLGLAAVYVLDLPQGRRVLTAQDLAALGLDLAELHRLALDNLRKDFPREMVTGALAGESGSGIQFGDSFDTARLLLVPEYLGEGEAVIALMAPHDMLLLLPASVADDPAKLEEGLGALKECDHAPLIDRPVRVSREGFEML